MSKEKHFFGRTYMLQGSFRQPFNWYIIDASNKILGRLASKISIILQGKHKPTYTPHLLCGDKVVVINASKIRLTGKKMEQKIYRFYSGYPGGLKEIRARDLFSKDPARLLELAVRRMLPDNKLRKLMMRNLYIYPDEKHPHIANKPISLQI